MESILDLKEALQARSTTATLEDLQSQGRKRVRIIRPEHIATMIQEAVSRALEGSNLVAPEEVQRLIGESRSQFQSLMQERERELEQARSAISELEEVRTELARANERIVELEQGSGVGDGDGAGASGTPHLVQRLMAEITTLKAQAKQPAGGGTADASIAAALEKLAGSLNERLDKFGRKIGVSGAVEEAPMDYGRLFDKQDVAAPLESNLDSVKLKQKTGGGIAANLERLRKLKGNG